MIRTFSHATLEALAEHATVPVINGLTDRLHPCQVLADLQTCAQAFGEDALGALKVAWIGDGNNMAHSWINAARVLGFELRLACPPDGLVRATVAEPETCVYVLTLFHPDACALTGEGGGMRGGQVEEELADVVTKEGPPGSEPAALEPPRILGDDPPPPPEEEDGGAIPALPVDDPPVDDAPPKDEL
jgi:hypothetical protein